MFASFEEANKASDSEDSDIEAASVGDSEARDNQEEPDTRRRGVFVFSCFHFGVVLVVLTCLKRLFFVGFCCFYKLEI